jgi:hypothetical protein
MPDTTNYNVGLGKSGLINSSGHGTPAIVDADVGRGWQSLGRVAETELALVSLNDKPETLCKRLPPEGRNIEARVLTGSSTGTVTVSYYGFPYDPGTDSTDANKNATDGNAAGVLLESYQHTVGATTADSPSVASVVDQYCSDSRIIDRRGYAYFAAVATAVGTVTASEGIEFAYRVF